MSLAHARTLFLEHEGFDEGLYPNEENALLEKTPAMRVAWCLDTVLGREVSQEAFVWLHENDFPLWSRSRPAI